MTRDGTAKCGPERRNVPISIDVDTDTDVGIGIGTYMHRT